MLITENKQMKQDIQASAEQLEISVSNYEKLVICILLALMSFIIVIASWSGILLLLDETRGGGPLGAIFNYWLGN